MSTDNQLKRTLFSIVLGCASTIIISTWRSLHPNIPPRESHLRRVFRKLDLIICTLIAPEILPLWALKQRMAAAEVSRVYNNNHHNEGPNKSMWTTEKFFSLHDIEDDDNDNEPWTPTHGHYLIMGGFHLIEPMATSELTTRNVDHDGQQPNMGLTDNQHSLTGIGPSAQRVDEDIKAEKGPITVITQDEPGSEAQRPTPIVLTLEMLKEILARNPKFEIQVTERRINDRSRTDVVSKIIFIFQTSWFIIQCIARGVQGLELTQLELTTVAFASLNVITFILWMKKPLGPQVPMRVYLEHRLTARERNAGRDPARESFRSLLPGYIETCLNKGVMILKFKNKGLTKFFVWLLALPFLILAFVLSPIVIIISGITLTFYDVMITSSSFPANASHVPPFYTPEHEYSWLHPIILSILCITVGGIHCAGWNFTFPTDTQRELWRAASLAVTFIPFVILVVLEFIFKFLRADQKHNTKTFIAMLRTALFVISVVAYVGARVFLVAQALVLLRNQQPSAFVAVDWTKFIPHA